MQRYEWVGDSVSHARKDDLGEWVLYTDAVAALAAAPNPPAGEPTDDMLRAGVRAFQSGYNGADNLSDWREFYRTVSRLAAHGAQPAPEPERMVVFDDRPMLADLAKAEEALRNPPKLQWEEPAGLLQDEPGSGARQLSKALASKPDARMLVRKAAQGEVPAEPSDLYDDREREEFYRVFNESTKLTGHQPTLYDVWLMARGRMDTSHRAIPAQPSAGEAEPSDIWHAVINPNGDCGVIFRDKADADFAANGVQTGPFVHTLADEFRELFDEEDEFNADTLTAAKGEK